MGYNTSYNLEWSSVIKFTGLPRCEHDKPTGASYCPVCGIPSNVIGLDELVGNYIESHEGMNYALEADGNSMESCKWYEYETDMRKMSEEIRQVLFTLHGAGEESEDIWNAYFLNGKMQTEKASIQILPFDKSKLK